MDAALPAIRPLVGPAEHWPLRRGAAGGHSAGGSAVGVGRLAVDRPALLCSVRADSVVPAVRSANLRKANAAQTLLETAGTMISAVYCRVVRWLQGMGRLTLFGKEVLWAVLGQRTRGGQLTYQLYFLGVKSQTVVLVTGAFTGMVLAAQTYFQFHKVRMDTATLAVVSVSMCSELGPVLTALMVAGRVGAALAAELGTMRVTEQIDALRTLATHPIDYLVLPRMLAIVLAAWRRATRSPLAFSTSTPVIPGTTWSIILRPRTPSWA
ncbi:MAG: hypothetical protein DME25_20955 [Verrucomicrobia bacterium]|nr:MAG: hypothetical protein DME25_20955 [Verrucomicrobiota bacterium]